MDTFFKFWERLLIWSANAWRHRIKKGSFAGWLKILLLFYLKVASLEHDMKFAFFLFFKYHYASHSHLGFCLPHYLFPSLHWSSCPFSSALWSTANSLLLQFFLSPPFLFLLLHFLFLLLPFLTEEKIQKCLEHISTYTFHFKVMLRRKKKISESDFCKASANWHCQVE